jgi:hypothetical protein
MCGEFLWIVYSKIALTSKHIGKYWYRHRRPMPVEYNTSTEYHANKIREAELARKVAKKTGGAAAPHAQNAVATPGDDREPASFHNDRESDGEGEGWEEVEEVWNDLLPTQPYGPSAQSAWMS